MLEAIDSLSENHKSVFNLYIIDQFSHLEISKLLQISVGTSKSSLSRARKNIQEFLAKKLNGKKTEERKKRRVLFLIFLGLENKMFAQKFQKSFASFEVQPSKPLDLNRKVKDTTFEVVPKAFHLTPYLKIGTLAIVVSVILVIYFSQEKTADPIVKLQLESEAVMDRPAVDTLNSKSVEIPTIPEQAKEVTQDAIPETSKVSVLKSNLSKDTITQNEPQKVIVITKKIIKKDTIYVQK